MRGITIDGCGISDGITRAPQEGGELRLALRERSTSEIASFEMQQIENVKADGRPLLSEFECLEKLEGRTTGVVERNDLAIEHGLFGADLRHRLRDLREFARQIFRVAREQFDVRAVFERDCAEAIELQFVH